MFDRITHDPKVLSGRATIRGLRVSVAHVLNLTANGMTPAEIVADIPDLELEDVRQALAYAAVLAEDQHHPLHDWVVRFLADAGVSPKTLAFLRRLGHEAIHVRDLGMQRATDRNIVDRARTDGSVVLTFDLDFGEILALGVRDRPSVIILRLGNARPDAVNRRLEVLLADASVALLDGALVSVTDDRYRIRRLPIGRPSVTWREATRNRAKEQTNERSAHSRQV
jgi:uncharacterized protein (DUF433 family)/predicted nuclease of predicted toxin-antitoxin system